MNFGNVMIFGDSYSTYSGHIPEGYAVYYSGKRNSQRVLWSNDGLVFVSYDHYRTFVEII